MAEDTFIPAPAPPAKRSDSLYERLKAQGWPLLNEVMGMLGKEEDLQEGARKRTKLTHRFLNQIGFKDQSESALTDMRTACRALWIYEKARHEVVEIPLPPDASEIAREKFRKEMLLNKMQAATSEELLDSEKMESEAARREQGNQRVQIAREALALKLYESQESAAAQIEAIFADAERMQAEMKAREEMLTNGLSQAERVEAIRLRLYGTQAAAKPQPQTQPQEVAA